MHAINVAAMLQLKVEGGGGGGGEEWSLFTRTNCDGAITNYRRGKHLSLARGSQPWRRRTAKLKRDRDHSEPDEDSGSQVDEPKEARRPKKQTYKETSAEEDEDHGSEDEKPVKEASFNKKRPKRANTKEVKRVMRIGPVRKQKREHSEKRARHDTKLPAKVRVEEISTGAAEKQKRCIVMERRSWGRG